MRIARDTFRRLATVGLFLLIAVQFLAYSVPENFQERKGEPVFTAYIKDSIPVTVDLIYDTDSLPDRYYAYIESPVCEDGVCYDLKFHLYWDLLGNFIEYKEVASDPFTKFEHDLFTAEDHIKLQKILADKTSPLANYAPLDLIDKNNSVYSSVIDGMAGATYPALKDEVVQGAVYSTHTLWNIVNGTIASKIENHTTNVQNEELFVKMIRSNRYALQMYGMRHIAQDAEEYPNLLVSLIKNGQEYVPFFAIAKLTPHMWADTQIQSQLIGLLDSKNFEMQNEILNGLSSTKLVSGSVTRLLDKLSALKESQYKKLSSIISGSTSALTKEDIIHLKKVSESNIKFAPYARKLVEDTKN
ncbi:hypothetical protein [Zobellia amurskyensis]|uniref:hypothetical protein n=1 Tax=Zobellia amurskyensis TaxID=248905 RepID=UPI0012D86E8A|nr:hypothetical protein [Zobellia amurskyensis]